MSLGACRLKRYLLALMVGLIASVCLTACGPTPSTSVAPPNGQLTRVLASQGVSSTSASGGLAIIDGFFDVPIRTPPLSAGLRPGLMAISPSRSQLAAFDQLSNNVYVIFTSTEKTEGVVPLSGPTTSMVIPTEAPFGYAAVPTANVSGFSFIGGVEVMNLAGGVTTTIAVPNAQTVVSNAGGTQLLVFGNDSDVMTVLYPANAVPPADLSCLNSPQNTSVCVNVSGFSRPVYAIVNGSSSTAYILNCGLQCGGSQPASVAVFDMNTLTITNTIPVEGATWAYLTADGSTLYVAGTPTTNNDCSGQTWGNPPTPTAATTCGRLDIINVNSGTVTASGIKITDGFHQRMDMSSNGQLFVGSRNCTNIGNVNNPTGGEIRGCLAIYNTTNNTVVIPPDNGDVNGLQSFSTRFVEYVAEGGALRVYDTTTNSLLINDWILTGTVTVVGYVGDVKAIDFF